MAIPYWLLAALDAGIAQGLERQPSKLRVAGSNPVSRSMGSVRPGRENVLA